MSTTYRGINWGWLAIMDAQSGIVIWRKYLKQERLADYKEGVEHLESKGHFVDGIVCVGLKGMFQQFSHHKVHKCQFHIVAIIRRYITNNFKLEAGMELKKNSKLFTRMDKESFMGAFDSWDIGGETFLKERKIDPLNDKKKVGT